VPLLDLCIPLWGHFYFLLIYRFRGQFSLSDWLIIIGLQFVFFYFLFLFFCRWIVKQAFLNVTVLNVSSKHTSVMGRMTALMALMRMPDMHVVLHLSGIRMYIWFMWYQILTVVDVKIVVFQKLKSCLKGVCSELLEEPVAFMCRLEAGNSRFLQNTCI